MVVRPYPLFPGSRPKSFTSDGPWGVKMYVYAQYPPVHNETKSDIQSFQRLYKLFSIPRESSTFPTIKFTRSSIFFGLW